MTAVVAGHLRDAARWLISGALVLAAHGGVAAVLVSWSDPLTPGMLAPLVLIELAPAASAPSLEKTDLPIDRPQELQELAPEPVEPTVAQEPTPEPVEKAERVKKEPEPRPIEQPPLREIAPTPPHKEVEVALPAPVAPPERKRKPKQRTAALATAPAAAERVAPRAAAPNAGAGHPDPNAKPQWKGLVAAHLQRHKRYPASAQAQREEGTAVLAFTVDRRGRVMARRIVRSSGHAELDREALAMVQRAEPFPPPPPELPGQQFPFEVPMRYYLR